MQWLVSSAAAPEGQCPIECMGYFVSPYVRPYVHPSGLQPGGQVLNARSQETEERTDVRMDKISPAFYRTLSLWGRCPAYQPSHQKPVNYKKIKKSRARVPMTIYCPWTTGSFYFCSHFFLGDLRSYVVKLVISLLAVSNSLLNPLIYGFR